MRAIAGLPPSYVCEILVRDGWVLLDETLHNWVLAPGDPKAEPLTIPKRGEIVDPQVMDWLCQTWPALGLLFAQEVHRYISEQTP